MNAKKQIMWFTGIAGLFLAATILAGCGEMKTYSGVPVDGGTGNELTAFRGTIVEARDVMLRIDADNDVQHEFMITPDTTITLNEMAVGARDLMPGQTVIVMALVQEDLITAHEVRATSDAQDTPGDKVAGEHEDDTANNKNPELLNIKGTIVSVGDSLTVSDAYKISHVFTLTDLTRILVDGLPATMTDLQVGQSVVVQADEELTAVSVEATSFD